ncbi:glycosyltransferase family 4 protein [Salimicrobium flavidum]|uniref:Glycosyltransferase involved in cell wall bisynthesis n=1 Tax=Salimicrobium flavidum TaxID=570947 RepID=A0A1N7IWN8_9BACI|nr:glycosyltransferase family 4 protein [Salimicrobium flavidum]SIS41411.1 Glycosyltransferase involved in cell wall bisynthesis [Salimicrobium flavidum]
MRIMMTTIFDNPHTGGLSTHVSTLKTGLEELGHEVDVVSFSDLPRWKQQLARGVSFLLNTLSKGKGIFIGHILRQHMLSKLIKRQSEDVHYDIINAQDVYSSLAAFESGVPVVSTVHGYFTFEAISRGSLVKGSWEANKIQKLERYVYRRTRRVITVDQRIRDYVRDLAGVEGERIYNFINIDQFCPRPDKREAVRKNLGFDEDDILLFVPRRMTKKNGVIYPVKALPHIHESYENVHLLYAGSGEEEKAIRQFAKQGGVENHVHFLGDLPHAEMNDYYTASDVALIPSIHSDGVEEATSISALEGMGSGTPVVASSIGGLKEMMTDRETGFLVQEQSTEAIRDAVIEAIEHPELREKVTTQARRMVEDYYSHRADANKFLLIYESVLEGSHE